MENRAEKPNFDYRAHKYKLLINEIELKKTYKTIMGENPLENLENIGLMQLNEYLLSNNYKTVNELNDLICENMQYNCSNVFIERTSSQLSDTEIQKGFEKIITKFNLGYAAVQYHEDLKKDGFNLIDRITPNKPNQIVFPVLKFNEKRIQIFSFVNFFDKENSSRIRMCSVDVDRECGNIEFYVNGATGGFTLTHNEKNITSALGFFKYMRELIRVVFNINFSERDIVCTSERRKMFEFCSKMNDLMIGEYSLELNNHLGSLLNRQINKVFSRMNSLNSKVEIDKLTRQKIKEKLFSTYLGEYITKGYSESELKELARDRGAVCYPTKISFKGQELSRGRASARGKNFPLTFETVFYSLNTDLSLAGQLEDFTVAWFDNNFFEGRNELSVSQTTIKVKKDYFSIVCNNRKNRNKEMTTFVIRTIRRALE